MDSSNTQTKEQNQIVKDNVAQSNKLTNQLNLLNNYHKENLKQINKSLYFSLFLAVVGFSFFLTALLFVFFTQENENEKSTNITRELVVVGAIGGVLIEVMSTINFYLYGRAAYQMAERLDKNQRFFIANSICDELDDTCKDNSRFELIKVIAGVTTVDVQLDNTSEDNKGNETNKTNTNTDNSVKDNKAELKEG